MCRAAQRLFTEDGIESCDSVVALLIALLENNSLSSPQRNQILVAIAVQQHSVSVSHGVLLDFCYKVNAWSNGSLLPEMSLRPKVMDHFKLDPPQVRQVLLRWADAVEEKSEKTNIFVAEEDPIAVLFRLGQFAEDYGRPRSIVARMMEDAVALPTFLAAMKEGHGIDGYEKIVPSWPEFQSMVQPYREKFDRAVSQITGYLPGTSMNASEPS